MKSFLFKIAIYLFGLLGILLGIISICSWLTDRYDFHNVHTQSNTLCLDINQSYDIVMMGISHARFFSIHNNHYKVEKILSKKFINLAQGGSKCGINEQLYYLQHFYRLGNKAEKVAYIISPHMFFSASLSLASNTFDYETFSLSFLGYYLLFPSENKPQRILSYLSSKLSRDWLQYRPVYPKDDLRRMEKLDTSVIKTGMNNFYDGKNTLDLKRFEANSLRMEETISFALAQGSEVYLIIPPALFGKWRGHDEVEKFALEMAKRDSVSYYNFSESVDLPEFYSDHHHLNTPGTVYFTQNYLLPIFK